MQRFKELREHPNYVGYGFLHYFFSCVGQTFFISYFKPDIQEHYNLTPEALGSIYGAVTIASAFTLPWAGMLIDRMKLRYFSLTVALTIVDFALVHSESNSLVLFSVGLFAVRLCGQALLPLGGLTGISRSFTQDRGKAISLAALGLSTAETIIPLIVPPLIVATSWEFTWKMIAAAVLIVFIPFMLLLVPGKSPFHFAPKVDGAVKHVPPKDILRSRKFYLLVGAYVFPMFLLTGFFFHQDLVAGLKNWEASMLAIAFSAHGFTRIFSTLLAGTLIDKYSAQKVFRWALLPLMVGMMTLLSSSSPIAAIFYLGFAGITSGFSSIAAAAMWVELYGTKHIGTIKGIARSAMVFGTALGSALMGFTFKHYPLMWTIVPALGIMALFTFSNIILLRKHVSS